MLANADWLIRKSVWLIGGDGWAYDIGFGGLDHALASGRNIKALVLDSEMYSNTGGQALVIAYSHCVAHGIDMAQGFARQKTAVETGHFPLFRYDPSRSAKGFSALELDSQPPSKSFAATASEENRFKLLLKRNPEHAVEMLSKAESFYRNYYARLEDLTTCNW